VATGLAFTPDCKHLLVTTQDGCIFIYKLPKELIKQAMTRLEKINFSLRSSLTGKNIFSPDHKRLEAEQIQKEELLSLVGDIQPESQIKPPSSDSLPLWARS